MEPASAGLRKIVGKVLRQCPPEEAAVLAWPAVCGKPVAERTTAVAFADGILTVAVPDAPWGAQLATFTPQYVAGFSELLGPVVREVRFKVAVNIAGSQKMKITDQDVLYVAGLANLDLSEDEQRRMVRDLNSILGYIDRLNELDTTNVPPMAQTAARAADPLREDAPRPSLPREVALQNAPDSEKGLFKTPKVIER